VGMGVLHRENEVSRLAVLRKELTEAAKKTSTD